jgi:nucleotide-binding universal stress UspA family protein
MTYTPGHQATDEHRGRIVVGVDGSRPSKEALRWAARQAQLTGARLLAVLVWEYTNVGWTPPYPPEFDPQQDARNALDAAIDTTFRENRPVEIEPVAIGGPPAFELLKASRGADLLVLGCRGHGALTGLLFGSVSLHCVTHATCPVVVIHEHETDGSKTDSQPT